MKGGGFLILLFLLICFLWGITAVVGRISRAFSSKGESRPQARQPVLAQKWEPEPPMPEQSALAATEKSKHDNLGHTLAQLERISKLRKEGALTEDEFALIKTKLIQEIQRI